MNTMITKIRDRLLLFFQSREVLLLSTFSLVVNRKFVVTIPHRRRHIPMLAQIFMRVPGTDVDHGNSNRVSRLHYLIDALIGIDSTKEDPFVLLTIRPKWAVPPASPARFGIYGGEAHTPRQRKQSTSTPHQALSVDRTRGKAKIGKVKMLEFNQAKNWAEIEQTHIRLFEFQPGGSPMIHPLEPYSTYHYRRK